MGSTTIKPKIGIIIQTRMSSTRLPGKVMKKLAGKEVLWHVIERCKKCELVDAIIVATSTEHSDDKIEDFCKKNDVEVFRGDLNNVLKRYYQCALKHNLDYIIRVTSDCPFVDPAIIDESIRLLAGNQNRKVVYVSNVLNKTFPEGLASEVFTFSALKKASKNAKEDEEKEHVTPYIRKNLKTTSCSVDRSYWGDFRLTLDEPKDYKLIKILYNKFYKRGCIVDVKQVIKFLRNNPGTASINAQIKQKTLKDYGGNKMVFRKATTRDIKLLFEWRNDPLTRVNSINTKPVPWENHVEWFKKITSNPEYSLFVAKEKSKLVGTIRIDTKKNKKKPSELSWTIAPKMRGQGLGKKMVTMTVKMSKKPLFAQIKRGNIASEKIAEHAGFKLKSKDRKSSYWLYKP
ncbi:MAG: GNAT family N-acetyltransferase [Patescibacteria group bacterium]